MKDRCYNPNTRGYENYGGKGIRVCDEWRDNYEAFRDWALANGYDSNADKFECTIDRIDNNGNYCPENCRFTNMKVQGNNKSTNIHFDYNGERLTGSQLAEKLGVKPDLIYSRRKQGWDDEKIMNTPLSTPKIYNLLNGDSGSLGQLCKKYKMAEDTVRDRIENGWDVTNAFLMPPKTRELFDVDEHSGLKNAICFMDEDYNKISQQEYCRRNNIPLDIPAFNDNNRPSFKRLIKD